MSASIVAILFLRRELATCVCVRVCVCYQIDDDGDWRVRIAPSRRLYLPNPPTRDLC